MKVFGWAADDQGCGYYRMGLPLHELKAHGHDTQVSMALSGFHEDADIIVGQRVCNRQATEFWQAVGRHPASKRPLLVYEVDDDLLGIHPENDLSGPFFSDHAIRSAIRRNVAVADLVTVTTAALADRVREWVTDCPPVAVVPNAIPASLLATEKPFRSDLVLGWAGSATHRPDFKEAGPQLRRFLRRHSEVTWHAIGANFLEDVSVFREFTRWVPDVETYHRTLDFTVGVAPLTVHPFNRCKSPIKAMEYAALGIPIVASDYGPYADYVAHGETGYLVKQDHEWVTYLDRLFSRPAERAIMGEKARRRAQADSIQTQYRVWEKTYEEALNAVQ